MPKPQDHSQGQQAEARTRRMVHQEGIEIAKEFLYLREVNKTFREKNTRETRQIQANIIPDPTTIRRLPQKIFRKQMYMITRPRTHCPTVTCSTQHR